MAFVIKQNDQRPYLTGQLRLPDGSPFNLNLATGASIVMRRKGTTVLHLKQPVIFTDAINGKFVYQWGPTDTATVGEYEMEIEINWAGEPQTIPQNSYYTISITDDIG